MLEHGDVAVTDEFADHGITHDPQRERFGGLVPILATSTVTQPSGCCSLSQESG
jgi:hypothetical protein